MSKKIRILLTVALLTLSTLMFAACGGDSELGQVDIATIAYDGAEITWGAVEGAYKYEVVINGADKVTTSQASLAYAAAGESITIEITPLGTKDEKGESASKTFRKLEGGKDIEIFFSEDGVASWDAVEGATAYIVEVNGKRQTITTTSFSAFEAGKRNTIRVKPSSTDNSTFADWSKTVSKTFLAAPTSIDYDGTQLTWKGSSEAVGYEVYINGVLQETLGKTNSLVYNAAQTSFSVTVRALGDGSDKFHSPESTEERFVYLAQITDFTVQNGSLSWPAVDDASSYSVKINGSTTSVTEPCVKDLVSGRDNMISVLPVGKAQDHVKYFSSWSTEQKVHIIASPIVRWNGALEHDGQKMNSFLWEPCVGVDHYEILVVHPDGTSENFSAGATDDSFGYDYLEAGLYQVSIKAVPLDGNGYYESAYSMPIQVVRLAPPTAADQGVVTSNASSYVHEFTAHVKPQSAAVGYSVFREGQKIVNASSSADILVSNFVDKDLTTQQTYTFAIQAIGAGLKTQSNGQKTVTLSSLSASNLTFTVTVLAVPKNLTVEGQTLTWEPDMNARGYKLSGFNADLTDASFNLGTIVLPNTYYIQVFAKGDGMSILSSAQSPVFTVRKLAAPTDLRIGTTGEQEGKVLFSEVLGAQSYRLTIEGADQSHDTNDVDNINDYITTTSVSMRVTAVADAYDAAGQVYCLTSQPSNSLTVTKLATPTWPTIPFNGTNLVWNTPANVNIASSYRVYNGAGQAYPGDYQSDQFSLEAFEAGEHTFKVKAIGNGTTTINSDISEPVTVTKLATPVISISSDRTSYEWMFVENAQRYVVRVDGTIVQTIEGANGVFFSYTPKAEDFQNTQGQHTVTVTAVSDLCMSSKPGTKNTVVKQLTAPKIESMTYSSDHFDPAGRFTVTATQTDASNATAFIFIVDGTIKQPQESGVYSFDTKNTGAYSVSVAAQGGLFDEAGNYYINSLPSANTTRTILGAPGSNGISLTTQGILKWNAVSGGNNRYEVIVDYGNGVTHTYTLSVPSCNLNLDPYGNPNDQFVLGEYYNYTFRICSLGNGSTTISSAYVEWRG